MKKRSEATETDLLRKAISAFNRHFSGQGTYISPLLIHL